jgi:cytochrome P450 family 26 subfamily A
MQFRRRILCRYGPIFRTRLVGNDLIVSLDPELSAHVCKDRVFSLKRDGVN